MNKHQLRTQETRARLMNAAEEVFVRDGYEGAQLEEIAAVAGRTKGSVYANFKSKEDLFLALFERRTRGIIGGLAEKLAECRDRKQGRAVFREFYVGLANDRIWPILTLEFKLYALRHPESNDRLHKAIEMTKGTADSAVSQHIFGSPRRQQQAQNDAALIALGPIVSALILESHLEPKSLTEKTLRSLLGRLFDALFEAI